MHATLLFASLLSLMQLPAVRATFESPQVSRGALSEAQKRSIGEIRSRNKSKAAPLALHLASLAKQANENMLADSPDLELGQRLAKDIRANLGQLLTIRIETIKEVLRLLTPDQRKLLRDEMTKPGAPMDLMEIMQRIFKLPGD